MTAPTPLPAMPAPRETAFDLVAAWALRANQRRLATWAIGGALDAIGIGLVRPGWWLAGLPFVCIASIGGWGLAAQRLRLLDGTEQPASGPHRLLRLAKVAALVLGTAAAVAAAYGALWLVLGTRWGPEGG